MLYFSFCDVWLSGPLVRERLIGLVVKASASKVEDPGFKSHLGQDFPGRVIQVTYKWHYSGYPARGLAL